MKCIVCGQRKGKRYCPAKNTLICAVCCGTKRIIEIDCPSDCVYLKTGRERVASEVFIKQYQKADAKKMKYWELCRTFPALFTNLEKHLVAYRKLFKDLTDAQVLEAISLLLKSYETEAKGVIYQYKAYQAEIQGLVDRLTKTIEEARRRPDEYGPLTTTHIVDCIKAIKEQLKFHVEENISPTGFLDFITPFHPEVNPRADASRIIIP
jgi:cell fate (sporulation/competence/biofilm development) regulator YmcA (YheA/YmcA/DUF963 family)